MAELQNPNRQIGGESMRAIVVLFFIFSLAFGVQSFKHPKAVNSEAKPPDSSVRIFPAKSYTASAAGQESAVRIKASVESETIVESELYRIRFSNRGGQVLSWILKRYTDDDGKPLDLINRQAASLHGYPLSLDTQDAVLTRQLAEALYEPSATGIFAAPGKLTFTYGEGGVRVIKTFTFDRSYIVTADVQVTDHGTPVNASLRWPAGLGDQKTLQNYNADLRFDASFNDKYESRPVKSIAAGVSRTGDCDYAGISDLYFAAIFLPEHSSATTVVPLRDEVEVRQKSRQTFSASALGVAVGGNSGHIHVRLFAGPKALGVLSTVHAVAPDGSFTGPSLEPLVRFGFLGLIARLFFVALNWIHGHIVSGWGWAILILTLIINLALMPMRIKSMRSQLNVQRIQPQINAIRARFNGCTMGDPRLQEMNREIFELQKREGIGMFSGLLPLLVQMPLLYGFYRMLQNVIELRHAGWLWLHDLSAPDPLHLLPAFFVLTMGLMQLLTPAPGTNPAQKKMLAFVAPIFSGFMTWHASAGLALYWAFGNVIAILQQLVMGRTSLVSKPGKIAGSSRIAKQSQLERKTADVRVL